jgi:dolichol kinase
MENTPLLIAGTCGVFLLSYLLLKRYEKRLHVDARPVRKIVHVALNLLALGVSFLLSREQFILLSLLSAALFLVVRLWQTSRLSYLNVRPSYGEVFLPLGIAWIALIAYSNVFVRTASMLILAFADSAAEVFGVPGVKKSLRGSSAFFLTALVILFGTALIFSLPLSPALPILFFVVALAGTVTERVSRRGSDNLTISVIVAGLLAFFLL